MFGIGMPEMLLILAVALIVIGPKKLPDLAKSLGRALGEFKRATADLKNSIESETQIGEVKNAFKDLNQDIKGTLDTAKLGETTSPPQAASPEPSPPEQSESRRDSAPAQGSADEPPAGNAGSNGSPPKDAPNHV